MQNFIFPFQIALFSIQYIEVKFTLVGTVLHISVADPHHINAVPDPDPACHFDPDPADHFDADPDPDPTF